MTKKLAVVFMLFAVLGSSAFAELMFGVSGALLMDTEMTAEQISAEFSSGENIWYGGFIEIAGKKLGIGASFNTSAPYTDFLDVTHTNMDASAYLSYHLFGSHAFLDPFAEIGAGGLVTMNDTSDNFSTGTAYWYAALGAGVNLGPIGIFGKFAYDFKMVQHLTQTNEFDVEYEIPYFQANDISEPGYMPNFRFTLGAKLIL